MKNTLVLLVIGLIIVFLGNVKAACVKTSILEDISLLVQKSGGGFYNMMAIPERLKALSFSGKGET